VSVLGPLEATWDGDRIALGGAKQRAVLAVLALEVGRVVSTERLVRSLWGDDAGEKATATLQVHVSNLRKALSAGSAGSLPPTVVTGRAPGYLLDLPAEQVDRTRFDRLVSDGRTQLASGRAGDAAGVLREALALWRGDPLGDLADEPFAGIEITRLRDDWLAALEARIEADVESGSPAPVVGELQTLVADHPLREQLWALLMLALYRVGRQADALAAYQSARAVLSDELGLEPGPELRELEHAILTHAPQLRLAEAPPASSATVVRPRSGPGSIGRLLFADRDAVELSSGRVVLGREPGCTVVLDDPLASRQHAAVRRAAEGWLLADLGSTNGTIVNGQEITEVLLAHGDEITIGDTSIVFALDT
jgi:DNA-binding SARP family transcriptional activator